MCCPAPLFFFDVLGSNWGQNQFFCKKAKKYSAENDVFSALFLVAGARFELTTFGLFFFRPTFDVVSCPDDFYIIAYPTTKVNYIF